MMFLRETETWKPIPGFDGYEASDEGKIRSWVARCGVHLPHPIRQRISWQGRMRVGLRSHNKAHAKSAHRIVLEAFVGPCPEGHECNHKDGNPKNNRLDNLEWVTKKANMEHSSANGLVCHGSRRYCAKLTESDVAYIRSLNRSISGPQLAKQYGVSRCAINRAIRGKTWKHVSTAPETKAGLQ